MTDEEKQNIIRGKEQIVNEQIEGFKTRTGIDVPFTWQPITAKTEYVTAHGTYNDFDITFEISIENESIFCQTASRAGYNTLEYSNITKKNLDEAKPYDAEFEAKVGFIELKSEYLAKQAQVARKYGFLPEQSTMGKSARYIEYRGCSSKKAFYTTKDAVKAIHTREQDGSPKLYYYKCPICHKYHLTKQARGIDKKKKKAYT